MNRPVSREIKHKAHSEQANALAIVVVFAIALFGFAGLSVDLGNVYVQRHKLQEATDAAALAAVVDWASGLGNAAAVQTGNRFAIANGTRSNDSVSVTTGTWNNATRAFNPGGSGSVTQAPAVRVTAQRTVPTPFARIV